MIGSMQTMHVLYGHWTGWAETNFGWDLVGLAAGVNNKKKNFQNFY